MGCIVGFLRITACTTSDAPSVAGVLKLFDEPRWSSVLSSPGIELSRCFQRLICLGFSRYLSLTLVRSVATKIVGASKLGVCFSSTRTAR